MVTKGIVNIHTLNPDQRAITINNNMRIASIAIATYDYLITLPSEIRLYKNGSRRSLGFILFVLIRYSSIITIIFSNVGFFDHHFTPNSCAHFWYVNPVFKAIQIMVSQAILAIRAYNIAQRNLIIGRTLVLAYVVAVVFEWFTVLYNRFPLMTDGNCMVGSVNPEDPISAWSFYLAAMLFDCLALSISTYYLLKLKVATASTPSRLLNMMLYDGLGFFVVLTAVNLMNVFLYRGIHHVIQSSGATLGYAVTWIMSQRILTHAREARTGLSVIVASHPPTMNTASSDVCFDGQMKLESRVNRNLTPAPPGISHKPPSEFDIEVHIDQTITRDGKLPGEEPIGRVLYPIPRSVWEESEPGCHA